MNHHVSRLIVAAGALAGLLWGTVSQATDVARRPLKPDVNVKPNVIFGMDDSGSMDWEILLSAYSGILNWDTTTRSYWSGSDFLANGNYYMSYLFPTGTGTGGMQYGDSNGYGKGVPPSPQFAPLRSSSYNPLYYNPAVTYTPWTPAWIGGALVTYPDATPTAAKSHPAVSGSLTMDLTANQTYNFYYRRGMRKPDDTIVGAGGDGWVSTSYFPATYWVLDTACSASDLWASSCVTAPDGRKLRRYEIKSGNTFPSGRSYADELQNFANWWSYYRKRKLMLAGAMGNVLADLSGMRLGVVAFNRRSSDVTMVDADGTDDAANRRTVAGSFYVNPADSGTPTTATLKYIGEQYRTNPNAIQYSCQRNNAFIVTDGFANDTATPPSYDASLYGSGAPFATTTANSLADVALAYFTLNLRDGRTTSGAGNPLSDGRVPLTNQTVANPDRNTNLHMNTYAVTLGARGTLWPSISNPFTTSFTWPTPTPDTPSAIDDLWHATINGRGQMYKADNPVQAAQQIQKALNDMLNQLGAQSGVSFTNVNLARSDGKAYTGKYTTSVWTGDLVANAVDTNTGAVATAPLWSAADLLAARNLSISPRAIASSAGGSGAAFTDALVGSQIVAGSSTASRRALVDWLRGDRSAEGTTLRARGGLMGPVINASPVVVPADRVVYVASGEGMLHAFDTDNGNELWAYVPASALGSLAATAQPNYVFQTLLDGQPTIRTIGGRRFLIAGRGAGGPGYYALDITTPRSMTSDTAVASKVLWDIGNGGSFVLGQSVGRPVIVQTRSNGTVALLTQGYNGSSDGKGRMYMVNAATGALLRTFTADDSGSGSGDLGLAQVGAVGESDGKVVHVYGGDLRGNVWHFDLEAGTTVRLARLKRGSVAQPVTTAPEVMMYGDQRIVLVGTGQLLGVTDFGRSTTESFFAIKDGAELTDARSSLLARTLVDKGGGAYDVSGSAIDWSTQRGWYVDLPSPLQVTTDPSISFGAVTFVANRVALSECANYATLFVLDVLKGTRLKTMDFAGMSLGQNSASQVTLVRTTGTLGERVVAQFQRGDGTTAKQEIKLDLGVAARKNAWRQVRRGGS